MIKFFRKIRQKLLSENKFSKYLLYAVGEIVLVVIGILIALQVNNWNESRKNAIVRKNYSISLISDFKKDSLDLNNLIVRLKADSTVFEVIQKRIKASQSEPDTIAKLFRYKFPFLVRVDYSFNNTTLVSLVGNNTVHYPADIRQSMATLIKEQNDFINANTSMIDKYFDILNEKSSYPLQGYFFDGGTEIQDKIWAQNDPLVLAADFERLADYKFAYTQLILRFSQHIQDYTHTLKEDLQTLEGI
ncbi:hypothetical protein J0X14_12630 [Muricauda sp. CAU 1633]|uniref:DUF6090 family protein n=1 Tax=Allomuricauda sp. CAU 1633 TaxID=2816036 RepID=UPI001A907A59|nr:DUF6090 family protein [Muricauda sp. CAU 1633]MBO0323145.1 hypothetical protein [Muricauda sp. CAU 1633]